MSTNLPLHFRYDFAAELALPPAPSIPKNSQPIDPAKNGDHTRTLVGFLPCNIMENFDKVQIRFLPPQGARKKWRTPEEVANAQSKTSSTSWACMGHYVGDASQPLHVTVHHHGWVGENPQGYSTDTKIHGRVDGYFRDLDAAGFNELKARIHPAQLPAAELNVTNGDTFSQIVTYILGVQKEVVPLYDLDKAGKLFGDGATGTEGKEFLSKQLVIGGQMLGDLWYSAWQSAPEDTFLESSLARRKSAPGDNSK